MHEKMEGSVKSGGVIKKKSSSGCLIIKKKGDNTNSGGGFGGLSSNNNTKEKKRPRLVESDSGSSDEDQSLEFMRRKVNDKRLHNGSMGYKRSELESREYHGNNVGMEISDERKRSRLDLFEFDEYDEFDGKRMRNEYVEDRFEIVPRKGGRNLNEYGVESSSRNFVVDTRKQGSYFDGSSSGRSRGVDHRGSKYQEMVNEPIRLQGKNGVLKVMVNKKKKMGLPSQFKNIDPSPRQVEERKGSRSRDVVNKDFLAPMPVYAEGSKPPEKRGLSVKEKNEVKLEKVKPLLSKGNKAKDLEIDGTDTSLKLAPPGIQIYSSKKKLKREAERSSPPENVTPVKGKEVKEGKGKRGCSTEKQVLREKIRGMLVEAGWTIDYRPRKNRDYLDAVYINPSGTAFWSIIKAYDALKKQLGEDNDKSKLDIVSPSFAPISEDLIHKLTRQTKKKIEEEMKRKRKEGAMSKSAKKSAVTESSDSDQSEEKLSSYVKQNHKSNRGNLSDDDLSDDSRKRKPKKVRGEKTLFASNSNVLQGRTSKVIGRCTLLVRGSNKGENSEFDGYVPYSGKRTVLAWLIDSGTAQLSEKVQYMNRRRTRVMLEGWVTRDGIHCGCCSKILTVSKFELHAGSKLRQPFQNMFLESGASLLQCQIDAWNKQDESFRQDFHTVDVDGDDPDDDTCGLCGDGGDLICCDSCPSTFHQTCLGIQILPSGDWHCPNCTCKFCGDASGNVAEEDDGTFDELMRCSFCEKKYHKSCSEEVYTLPMTSNGASFCGLKCQELYDHLQKILGVKHELEAGFTWSLIQRADVSDTSHRGFHQRVECNSKLAVALSVMDECFLPINDRRSGINMMHNVVYNCGSNFNRLNYRGFYTVILERGDEIISAASIRMHGTRLAEMPFIGTRAIYRRQGMCRRLLSAIETELSFLNVEQLIIPAISEHMNTWTTVFGFHQPEDELKKEIKTMNMLVFPGTDMLQKQIVKQESPDGTKVSDSMKNQPHESSALEEKSDIDSPMEHNKQVIEDSEKFHESNTNDEVNALDCSPAPSIPSDDNKAGSVSYSENGLVDPPIEDNTNSSETEALPRLESIHDSSGENVNAAEATGDKSPPVLEKTELVNVEGNVDTPTKVSEDSDSQLIVNNGLDKSPPGSVNEDPDHSVKDKLNGEPIASTPVIKGEEHLVQPNSDLNQPTVVPVFESELHSSIEPSPVANNGSSLEVFANNAAAVETTNQNENQNHVPIANFPDSGESITSSEEDQEVKNELVSSDAVQESVDPAETVKTSPSSDLVNGKVDSSISSTEVLVSSDVVQEAVDPAETDKTSPSSDLVNGKVDSSISFPLAQNTTATD